MRKIIYISFLTLLWACGESPETENTNENTDSTASVSEQQASEGKIVIETKYIQVDNLNMRPEPGIDSKVIFQLVEGDAVQLTGKQSEETYTALFRGTEYSEPWIEVTTENGITGYVHGGALVDKKPQPNPKLTAEWYDTPQKRKDWWNGLSSDWKKVLNKMILNADMASTPTDEEIQQIFKAKDLEASPDAGCGDINFEFELTDCEGLKCLTNLTYLNLSYNKITDFSPLKSLNKLEYLTIDGCEIKSFAGLANLKSLKMLSMDGCELTSIKGLIGVTNLDALSIQYNKIPSLEGTQNMKKLTSIYCESNKLGGFDGLQHLDSLKRIEIGSNGIKDLSSIDYLTGLTKLEYLNIESNQELTDLRAIKKLKTLKNIGVHYIKLESLEGLENLKEIGKVYDYNQEDPFIQPEEIERMEKLGIQIHVREEICGC